MAKSRNQVSKTTGQSTRKKKTKATPASTSKPVATRTVRAVLNSSLSAAKKAKQDEFYTQYVDIQKEVEAYLEFNTDTFRRKIIYCNCDDPFESNFFRYFAANFNKLGLKRLICTSYDGSPIAGQMSLFPEHTQGNGKRKKPKAIAVIVDQVKDENNDGVTDIEDVKLFLEKNQANRIALKGNDQYAGGDFRSPECVAFLKQADIVVTNPPFSLFREYVAQILEHGKKILVLGDQNAITYREIFQLIKANTLWLGVNNGGTKWFQVPDDYDIKTESRKKIENGVKYFSFGRIMWFTNLDHGRRHQFLPLMTAAENLKFGKSLTGKKAYDRYDNLDAIEVPTYKEIPSDFGGVMGVPITFLDKYNPDQFEIVGSYNNGEHGEEAGAFKVPIIVSGKPMNWNGPVVNGTPLYKRILIRHRNPAKGKKK